MTDHHYQHGFSELHRAAMYDTEGRAQKAKKSLSVLSD
jgi:hypothetical protein